MSSCIRRVLRYTGLCGSLTETETVGLVALVGFGSAGCMDLLQFSRTLLRKTLVLCCSVYVCVQERRTGQADRGGVH